MSSGFTEQALPQWHRAVLKVGSSLLTTPDGALTGEHADALAAFVRASRDAGREVVIVSSGAVAAGRGLAPVPTRSTGLSGRQALAALGQTRLVGLWQTFFDAPVAQVLLTHDDLRNRRRYLNARTTLRELLALGAIPVINENDTVAVDELKLGDNDNLAAIVAALVDADVLFIASDIAGLYTANPRIDPDAVPVAEVLELTAAHLESAGGAGSAAGTGGMRTKLEAAMKAAAAGIETVLFDGRDAHGIARLADGFLTGTRLRAPQSRLAARKYWLRHAPAMGRISVDSGAVEAVRGRGASLLPGGVSDASGEFARGDVIEIAADGVPFARGIAQYAATDVRRIARRHTRDIEAVLGYSYGETIVHRDDLVVLPDPARLP
ncbi:glutamate 5-kinase [Luteibacter aegosomatissinici]|uniref:glutamate 5-kinase n=1 Tax=Luteibacter aegosomatissinici TaxID=2911539 RepID=UPI001FFA44DF|nr:glutamate 5-kinase [Luteibacter aegosomatissinici]UPG93243.1 glutamate 5-kinase [Luteibacter aegosomatissinici]